MSEACDGGAGTAPAWRTAEATGPQLSSSAPSHPLAVALGPVAGARWAGLYLCNLFPHFPPYFPKLAIADLINWASAEDRDTAPLSVPR